MWIRISGVIGFKLELRAVDHQTHLIDPINTLSAHKLCVPVGLVVRIRRSHRRGRGSIPRLGVRF